MFKNDEHSNSSKIGNVAVEPTPRERLSSAVGFCRRDKRYLIHGFARSREVLILIR
jgi:hypothetical protein